MSWSTFRVRSLAVLGAIALAGAACTPASTSSPTAAPKPGVPTPNPTAVGAGQALILQKGCGTCHAIPGIAGATGAIGPNLAVVANRPTIAGGAVPNNGPDDLQRWIFDPPAVKPGTAMPKLSLTDDEAANIVAYLETLR